MSKARKGNLWPGHSIPPAIEVGVGVGPSVSCPKSTRTGWLPSLVGMGVRHCMCVSLSTVANTVVLVTFEPKLAYEHVGRGGPAAPKRLTTRGLLKMWNPLPLMVTMLEHPMAVARGDSV